MAKDWKIALAHGCFQFFFLQSLGLRAPESSVTLEVLASHRARQRSGHPRGIARKRLLRLRESNYSSGVSSGLGQGLEKTQGDEWNGDHLKEAHLLTDRVPPVSKQQQLVLKYREPCFKNQEGGHPKLFLVGIGPYPSLTRSSTHVTHMTSLVLPHSPRSSPQFRLSWLGPTFRTGLKATPKPPLSRGLLNNWTSPWRIWHPTENHANVCVHVSVGGCGCVLCVRVVCGCAV